jgi:hypothetical protein
MHPTLVRLRTLAVTVTVLTVLGFGARVAFAGPATQCDNPPVVVGSCAEPGFDCQAECELANPGIPIEGSCQPTGQQCCICFEI